MKAVPGASSPSAEDIKREQHYQAQNDLRTLHAAHKVKSDPARHGRAMMVAKQHLASLKAMVGGKAAPKPNGDKETAADRAGPDSELSLPY